MEKNLDNLPSPINKALSLKDEVLLAAGISPEKMASLLKEAVNTVQSKLTAKETKFFAHQGEIVQTEYVDSHSIQLEAAKELIKLASSLAALSRVNPEGKKSGPVNIQVNLPSQPVPSLQGQGEIISPPTPEAREEPFIIDEEGNKLYVVP